MNKENFVHKYLPKQTDIDKILKMIQRKVLKGTHLPIKIKEVQAGYVSQNKLPTSKSAIRKIETLAEKYVLLDSLLFRISSEKETAVLAVPETCTDKIITLYHQKFVCGTPRSYKDFSLSLYVPYPMMWVIMDFHSSLSLAFSNSATSW